MFVTSSFIIFSVAKENHSDADCLLVTVLTQGAKNGNLALYEQCYHPNALCLPFTADKCKDLAGKPKIFIIQVSEFIFVNFYHVAL
jgi:caspase-like apoptosis-related cysteine protease